MSTTYYVAPPGSGGSDSNPGTIGSPFATINHACTVMVAGDTTLVRTGTYDEQFNNAIPGGTSSNVQVTIAAYPGSVPYEVVTIQPSTTVSNDSIVYLAADSRKFITIQGLVIDGINAGVGKDVVKITAGGSGVSTNITIKDCEIKNSNGHQGILIASNAPTQNADNNTIIGNKVHDNGNSNLHHGMYITSNNNTIDGNECYNNAGYGIQVYHASGHDSNWCSNNIIRNNKIHDNNTAGSGSGGIVIATGDANLVYNNLVYNNTAGGGGGIQCFNGVNTTSIYNNTVYNCSDYGIHIQANCTSTIAENNILYSNSSGALIDNGTGSTVDHNTTNSQDPLFVNLAGGDFHIIATSPAVDAGTTIAQVTTDFDGASRPQGSAYDIGAYEYTAGAGGSKPFLYYSHSSLSGKSPMKVKS